MTDIKEKEMFERAMLERAEMLNRLKKMGLQELQHLAKKQNIETTVVAIDEIGKRVTPENYNILLSLIEEDGFRWRSRAADVLAYAIRDRNKEENKIGKEVKTTLLRFYLKRQYDNFASSLNEVIGEMMATGEIEIEKVIIVD
ncbi:MAG: hypothetical protein WA063_05680 [Minisyncoccia bacterium]